MRMRIVLVVLGCLAAVGCSLAPPKTWKNNYALRSLQAPPGRERAHESPVPATLRVAAVDAPTWLAGRDMYYQLTYSSRDRVSAYSESRWLAPPSVMLQRLLLEGLSTSGGWKAVIGPDDNAGADWVMHLRLMEFQQTFASEKQSFGLLLARGTLIDARQDAVRAQRTFRFEVPAPSADSDGGAQALSEASHDLVNAVRTWLRTAMSAGPGPGGE